MIEKQWNKIYLHIPIYVILLFGFINIILKTNQASMILAFIGTMLVLYSTHEILIDVSFIKTYKKDRYWNNIFIFFELLIGILTFLLLKNWYNALIIYIVVKPSTQWIKRLRILLPMICYLIYALTSISTRTINITTLSHSFYLVLICLGFYYIEELVQMYQNKEMQILDSVKNSVLNELLAQNISRELTEKVHLVEENARYEERETIARTMHNAVGHTITSAIMALNATKIMYEVNPDKAKEKLSVAEDRMHRSLNEIRQAVRVLDKEINELSIKELAHMLRISCEQFMLDTELQIIYNFNHYIEGAYISNRHCEFLHSSLSEVLTNGIRHGGATRFYVTLLGDSRHVKLIVKDNGTTFYQLSKDERQKRFDNGYGLKKIQKYITACGGIMKIEYDEGFHITMELPILNSEMRMNNE